LMTSFNHPLMILSKSLAPALATGNSVVIKPSEQTPLTTVRLVELLDRAGIPKGVVNLVNGVGAVAGAALAAHPKIRKVVFTGSTDVGRSIGEAAARNFAAATLELGGKGAVIIFDDMDMDRAVNGAAFAAFIAAGQTCVCGSRILVQRSIFPAFLEKFGAKAASIRVGDPADPRTQLGPVISEKSRRRILAMIDRATTAGAKVLTGGKAPPNGPPCGFFIEPTVLYNIDPRSEIAQEEVFGPVTVVMPFDDEADAIRTANDTEVRSGRIGLDRRCRARSPGGESTAVRHGLGERPSPARSGVAVGRLQGQRDWPRDRHRVVRSLYRSAHRDREYVRGDCGLVRRRRRAEAAQLIKS